MSPRCVPINTTLEEETPYSFRHARSSPQKKVLQLLQGLLFQPGGREGRMEGATQCIRGVQGTTFGSQFSSSTIRVPGVKSGHQSWLYLLSYVLSP